MVTALTLIDYVKPSLTIALGDQTDPSDPLSYHFNLRNDGHFELKNLVTACISFHSEDKFGSAFINSGLSSGYISVDRLGSGESATVLCSLGKGYIPISGDIQLEVQYQYFDGILKGTKLARFDGEMGQDGRLHWESKPPSAKFRFFK